MVGYIGLRGGRLDALNERNPLRIDEISGFREILDIRLRDLLTVDQGGDNPLHVSDEGLECRDAQVILETQQLHRLAVEFPHAHLVLLYLVVHVVDDSLEVDVLHFMDDTVVGLLDVSLVLSEAGVVTLQRVAVLFKVLVDLLEAPGDLREGGHLHLFDDAVDYLVQGVHLLVLVL